MPKVLPGQDVTTLRSNFAEDNESDVAPKSIVWPPSRNEERNDACTPMKLGSENWIQMGRPELTYTDMLSGFQKSSDSHSFSSPYFEHNSGDKKSLESQFWNQEGERSLFSSQWSVMSFNSPFNLESNMKMPTQAVRYGGMGGYMPLLEQNHPNLFTSLPSNAGMENLSQPQVVRPQPVVAAANNGAATGSSPWKIFGFNLNSNPSIPDPVSARSNATHELESCSQPTGTLHQSSEVLESGQSVEPAKSTKSVESASTGSEWEKGLQLSQSGAKDVQGKPLGSSTRSCTKVLIAVVRLISSYACIFILQLNIWLEDVPLTRYNKYGLALGILSSILS